eukprot:1009382-Pelagomonas_calceolata.AAC.2
MWVEIGQGALHDREVWLQYAIEVGREVRVEGVQKEGTGTQSMADRWSFWQRTHDSDVLIQVCKAALQTMLSLT